MIKAKWSLKSIVLDQGKKCWAITLTMNGILFNSISINLAYTPHIKL